ncbi:efflux RND transporter permease subunit [Parabacteroides gordonii]|jgi:multidrug efflux pump subunit AcrB/ABC-type multidrug transport system ATPase subunit|uniref:efflux RND transporter permease subunit n=1 Tax=Parabacteroides gordonii TaxID=574930 RepID=UPI000EDB8CF4|nr:efflux RND transporter permease subunit [Parabacteroides gordonii]RGP17573.1 ATP-binding cassette domain-containing protein [Parabacteroides gordonii]
MNFLLHRRITISMLFIALSLLGYVSYKQLPVELLPNAELPMLFVQVSSQQDMDPQYVESEVIIPLEGAISSIGGVDKIQSNIDSRQSNIQVDFKNTVNFKITSLRLQEKVNELAATFPEGFTVQLQKVDVSQLANNFMVLQVRGSGGIDRVRNIVDKEIRSDLENIDGVASVNVYGGREKAIEIRLHPEACRALDLTPSKISSLLTQNTQDKAFVGFVDEPDSKYFIHVNSLYTAVSDLENIVVAPGPVLLKDVGTVFFDLKEETSFSRVNGKDAVSVALTNDSQANLIDLSHRATEAIDKLNKKLEHLDVEVVVQENTAETMENNIDQIINLALIGGLLAVLILWLFLKNLRLVFFIALSIPISVYTAFNFFYAFGITINSLTLVGMALAIGMLLDNSVVVLENIYRLSGTGATPERSVTQGTREVWRSIVAATLTTVTVFLPFVFSDNFMIKLIGHHIGVSIISTLTISLFVALLFIPMATYTLLRKKTGQSVFYEKVSIVQRPVQIYLVFLKTCMRNSGVTIIGAIILLFATLILSITLNVQQMKDVDSDRFNIYATMQTGSTLDNTDKVVKVMEERLTDFPEMKDLICRIRETDAVLTLVLKDDYTKIGKRKIADIKADVQSKLANIQGVEISVNEAMGGGGAGSAMSGLGSFMRLLGIGDNRERIVIKGSDFDVMQLVAEDFRYYLDEQEFIRNSNVSYNRRQPEIRLDFDPILLTSYDISRANISSGLAALNSEYSSGSSFKVGEDTYDIIIRNDVPEAEEEEEETGKKDKTIDDLRAVQIQNAAGGLHNLQDLASINYGRGRSRIMRVNQDKQIEVFYNFSKDVESSKDLLEGYRSDIDQLVAGYNLPAGVAVEVFHEEDQFADFKFLIVAAFILIFMILASVFESLVTPFVLLFSIPLAAIGSLLALLLTGNSLLNANTLTGFLILLGVVVNNGIILIDYSNILRRQGYRRNRALMTAGLSRIRPILITSITTIVAMFPLAMGDAEYAGAIGAPFAITVIGGLAFSALLTLILIPTVCMGLENTLQWYRGLSPKIWILHLVLFLLGIACIWLYADGMLWQSIYLVLLVFGIPGVTYFAQTSLRRARSKVIDPGEEIHISVRNLVKIYDWPGRFSRQWNSGLHIRRHLGLGNEYRSLKDFVNVIWQFGMLLFGIYFTWFFIDNRLWIFLLSFAIYATILYLWRKVREYLYFRFAESKTVKYINRVIFWSIPPVILFMLFLKMDNTNLVGVVGLLWAFCIAVYISSQYLYEKEINIERIKGRMAGLRRSWFRMVKSIPLIGKQRKPFKALRGVSFEIRTGMFGLLGPNGAGKSTLMRVICGIFEQSYGSIWINGLDTRIYREELQSLIGFLPQEFGTYENMSSWEFLDYQAILKGITDTALRNERLEYVLKAVHMYERKDDKIGSFSGGMKQRIGIALILLHLPRILVVDEPTAGLDPRERIRFRNLLVELSRDRIVIFSTHIIEDISSSCSQVVVINKGDLKYFGDPINMVDMAAGKVWQFHIGREEFEKVLDKTMVIHHIQDGDTIQVRYLSAVPPYEGAVQVEPNLEDAYLCLLKNMND